MVLDQIVFYECKAMAKYALGSGLRVSSDILDNIQKYQHLVEACDETRDQKEIGKQLLLLNKAHYQLSKTVAPARPKTLALFDREDEKTFFNFLGPVSLVRKMMIIAIFSLVLLIALSISTFVNGDPKSFGLTTNSGISLLINQLFLMSAASIGASFSTLFQVNQYIKNSTYDPMYESTYWIRFVLGILAGTMLVTLIPLDTFGDKSEITNGFGRPLLALIGGFSSTVVFRILTRLTAAVESVFKGDTRELMESQEIANNMKMEQQTLQTKMQLLNQLKTLQRKIDSGGDSKELMDELAKIQGRLLDDEK